MYLIRTNFLIGTICRNNYELRIYKKISISMLKTFVVVLNKRNNSVSYLYFIYKLDQHIYTTLLDLSN